MQHTKSSELCAVNDKTLQRSIRRVQCCVQSMIKSHLYFVQKTIIWWVNFLVFTVLNVNYYTQKLLLIIYLVTEPQPWLGERERDNESVFQELYKA